MSSKAVSYKDLFAEFISASDLMDTKIVEQLHEEIGSDLMALKLKLSASILLEEVKEDVDLKINSLLCKIKALSNQFYPAALDELGLLGALRSCVRRFNRLTDVSVEFNESKKKNLCMSLDRQRQLYYITEEVLIKIIEDSNENFIRISIQESDGFVTVAIVDAEEVTKTILSNENFLTDLGIQKMHSRLNKIAGRICCQMENNVPTIKIIARNEKKES